MIILLNIQSFNDESLFYEIVNISLNKDISQVFLVSSLMNELEDDIINKYKSINKVTFISTNSLFNSNNFAQLPLKNLNISKQNNIYSDLLSSFRWLPISERRNNDILTFSMTMHYDVYNFWEIFFKDNKIDSVISLQVEHSSLDRILIEVAKENNITNIITTVISGWQASINEEYFALYDNVNETMIDLIEYKSQNNKINKYDYEVSQNHSDIYKSSGIDRLYLLFNRFKKLFKTKDSNLNKIKILKDKVINKLSTQVSLYFQIRYIKELEQFYKSLSLDKINEKEKYVYYCLHFDPEATTLPKDTVFSNQLLNIRIIASALPKGWKLYVKEHPHQLKSSLYKNIFLNQLHAIDLFRSKSFYSYINQLNNVNLISLDTEHKSLIKNAEYIASNTGTVFREAIVMKKQCITFSKKSIYLFLNNVHCVQNFEDCKRVFNNNDTVKYESVDELFNKYTFSISDINNRASILLNLISESKVYKGVSEY